MAPRGSELFPFRAVHYLVGKNLISTLGDLLEYGTFMERRVYPYKMPFWEQIMYSVALFGYIT